MHRINCRFLIRPMEPLYFGKPSSFSAGEGRHGQSEFPPTPLAFQGIVRSHLLRSINNPELDLNDWTTGAKDMREELVGGSDFFPSGWQLKGPYPVRPIKIKDKFETTKTVFCPWVPTPLYMLKHQKRAVHAELITQGNTGFNDLGKKYPQENLFMSGRPDLDALKPIGGWIGPANLSFALEKNDNKKWDEDQYGKNFPPFIHQEYQPGVAIDSASGTSKQGMLYALKSLRFEYGSGLVGWFDGQVDQRIPDDALAKGVVGAGRKNRAAILEEMPDMDETWQKIYDGIYLPPEPEENQLFWIVALSPVRVADPVHPVISFTPPDGVRIVIHGAITGKPAVIGGFQMADGRTRPNRLYIPAGSSWLFRLKGGTPQARSQALSQLHNSNALGPRNEAAFGFGHIFIGIGPKMEEKTS